MRQTSSGAGAYAPSTLLTFFTGFKNYFHLIDLVSSLAAVNVPGLVDCDTLCPIEKKDMNGVCLIKGHPENMSANKPIFAPFSTVSRHRPKKLHSAKGDQRLLLSKINLKNK